MPKPSSVRAALMSAASISALAAPLAISAGLPTRAAAADARVETIIVSTTRREESIQDVPASVAALTGEQAAPYFESGQDVLAFAARVPSVYAESSNGRVAPRFYIRGLGNTDFDLAASQPVSIIMDDVVMENVTLKSFPLFDIEQVEISRGPQGTLFGRNTTAGIIKFDSRRPTDEFEGYGTASYGSYDTINLEGAVGGPLVEGVLSGRLSVLSQNRSDWIDNAYTGVDDALGGYNELAARAQLLWEPSDTLSVLGNLHARSLDGTAAVFRANILTTGSNKLNGNFDRDTVYFDSGDDNPQEYDGVGGSVTVDYETPWGTLTSISAYESTDGRSRGDIDGGVCGATPPAPPGITSGLQDNDCFFNFDGMADTLVFPGPALFFSDTQDSIDTLDQLTQELRFASDASGAFNWQTGVYLFRSEFEVTTQGPGFPPLTTVKHENDMWAVFGQASYDLTEQLTVSGGLRYTSDEKDFTALVAPLPTDPVNVSDEELSWDLSGLYAVNEDLSLYARVARGFRGPSIQGRDVAFFGAPSAADSETSTSYEAGFKAQLPEYRTRINGSAFVYEVSDLQLSAVGGAGNLIQLVNADSGQGYGFELELDSDLTDRLSVMAGLSYNHTELDDSALEVAPCGSGLCTVLDPDADNDGFVEVDGNPFPQAPEWVFNVAARYGVPIGQGEAFVQTDWFYQGETNLFLYETAEFSTDGNFEGGLRVGYAGTLPNGADYEAAVFARNITDEENLVGAIDFNNNTGFVNEPRVFGVSFTARF
jgi:outer membrane receptor protein involved in Fe transport